MRAQKVGSPQCRPHAAQAQCGIFLRRQRQIADGLVAADIECADDERPAAKRRGDRLILRGLLVFRRRRRALLKEKLRAQEAATFRALRHRLRRFIRTRAEIGEDFDAYAIGRPALFPCTFPREARFVPLRFDTCTQLVQRRSICFQAQLTLIGVEHDLHTVRDREHALAGADDRRNVHAGRKDRNMRCRATTRRAKARDAAFG